MDYSVLFSNAALEESVDHSDFEEEQDYEQGFGAYFDREIKPMREDLESRRIGFLRTIRRRFRKSLIWGGPWLAISAGNAIAGFMGIEPFQSIILWFDFLWYLVLTAIPLGILGLWTMMPAGEYKETVKDEVFTRIVRFFGDDWRYKGAGGFDENMIQASDIKPSYNRYNDEDCFSGCYKDIKISFAEVKLIRKTKDSEGRDSSTTVFEGLCLAFSMNKRFKGKTIALADRAGWLKRNKKKVGDMERVELEDPDFEKKFEVYGTDQIEARYLLTTAFMDRVLNLSTFLSEMGAGNSMEFEFWDKNLFIMIPSSSDFFEPGTVFEPALQIADIRKFLKEMSLIFGIVDALKLNLDIGL
jgi:hypothetical protein